MLLWCSSVCVDAWMSTPSRVLKGRIGVKRNRSSKLYNSNHNLSSEEIKRYSRHLVLADVGMKGQSALKDSSVLVIGAGGLGSPCLLYLAAAGVGHIGIVDADVVEESNLQRQIIHGTSTVGITKCESAKRRIHDVNPFVQVTCFEEEFTSQTAMRILQDGIKWDVVVDGSDNFPTKYCINDACYLANIPWVYSAILAFEGQVSVLNYPPNVGPTYRDLLPTPPDPSSIPSCAEGGVLGVLPGTMGCLQATETLKILLDKPNILSGKVLVYDALSMAFQTHGLSHNPENNANVTNLMDYQGFCAGPKSIKPTATASNNNNNNKRTMDEAEVADVSTTDSNSIEYHNLTPKEALEKLMNGWAPYVLDVRLKTEYDIVSLPFTDNVVPHRTVTSKHIPESGDVLVSCKMGGRSKQAIQTLITVHNVNPKRLYNLNGGIMRWQSDIDPSMPRY